MTDWKPVREKNRQFGIVYLLQCKTDIDYSSHVSFQQKRYCRGVCWMFLILLSFEQHYVLICLLFYLLLEGGVTFFFSIFSVLYFFVFYCSTCIKTVSWATNVLLNWIKWMKCYVWLLSSQFRLSSVCLSVWDVDAPYSVRALKELLYNILHRSVA